MQLHVVLASHDRAALLARTLESVAAAARPPELERVIVVENGASGVAKEVCERYAPRLPMAHHRLDHPSKSRALQWAVAQIRTGFVVFLDDDVRVAPEVFEAYADAAREHGPGHFYGGPLSIDYEREPASWLRSHLPHSARGWEPRKLHLLGGAHFMGANLGVFAEDVLAVGGFDPHFGPGAYRPGTADNPTGQEREFQERMRAAGHLPIYVPRARVWHWVAADRCTPGWALQRAYRASAAQTMRGELRAPAPGMRWRGAPLALWPRLALAAAGAATLGVVGDAETRYLARRRFQVARGAIRGHQLAGARRQRGPAPGAAAPHEPVR